MAASKPVNFATIQIQAPDQPEAQKSVPKYHNASVRPAPSIDQQVFPAEGIMEIEPQSEVSPLLGASPKKNKRRRRRELGEALTDQQLQFSVQDVPPWYLSIIMGFQHYLIMFGATVAYPLLMSDALCIRDDDNVVKSELIGTIFFVSGICTLLQTIIGVRLPIVQGGTYTFITASLAILQQDRWKCPDSCGMSNSTTSSSTSSPTSTSTFASIFAFSANATSCEDIWKPRIREIQGAIMVASIFQVVIGFTGIVGTMLRFIGPLSIAPTIALAGLALFEVASKYAAKEWWITLVTIVLIAAFSQYTKNINIPCFRFERGVGCVKEGFPFFRLFPVIIAVTITWAICAILTAAHVFSGEAGAATNLNIDIMKGAPWFRFPYPGQWGLPTVSAASVFGVLSAVLANIVQELGNYYACARMSQVPPPPMHAINRGIGIGGIGCIIAGAFGSVTATTVYSENIGAIGITKVASLRVFQIGAVIMMIFGVFGKFGAFFLTIPDPIIGGVLIVMFGMITAVGIANLQFVDLNSSRNLFIIGFSFFFGLTLPQYIASDPKVIQTGFPTLDQIITVLLRTNMFVGGLAGFALDNTIPGTDHERGLIKWRQMLHDETQSQKVTSPEAQEERVQAIYDIPLITPILRRHRWTRFVPFLPTFDENILSNMNCRRKRKQRMEQEVV